MALIPPPMHQTAELIYALHARRVNGEPQRAYLGVSEWGHECARYLWNGFHWVMASNVDGRLARLFDSGHREEARTLTELRKVGLKVKSRAPSGGQYECSFVGGHVKGHVDAFVRGFPEAPKTEHLVDVKSIKRKRLDELKKKGFRETFPIYWAQGQGYMGAFNLERAAYIFVCKDDEEIHLERFEFDREAFERLLARAESIVMAAEPPARLSDDPEFYVCRMCRFRGVCHGQDVPLVNCRTCLHSTPVPDRDGGEWTCGRDNDNSIDPIWLRLGCNEHRYIPALLANIAEPIDADEAANTVTYRKRDGTEFVNDRAGI